MIQVVMAFERARQIVDEIEYEYVSLPDEYSSTACLDGDFTADQLLAISIVMRAAQTV